MAAVPPPEAMPPAYGPPAYSNPGFSGPSLPTWQQQQQQTVIYQQAPAVTHIIATQYGENPVSTVCPMCQQPIVTYVERSIGAHAIGWCICLFCFGCDMGCCFIPFCMDSCLEASHECPNCSTHLGDWNP